MPLGEGGCLTVISTHFLLNPPLSRALRSPIPPPPSPNDCKGEQKSSLLSSQHPWPGGCWVLRHVPPRRWVRVAAGWVLFPAPGCRNSSSQLRRALLSAWLFARNNLWIMLVPIRLTPPGWLEGKRRWRGEANGIAMALMGDRTPALCPLGIGWGEFGCVFWYRLSAHLPVMHLWGKGLVHNDCWGLIICKRPHDHGVRSAVGAPSCSSQPGASRPIWDSFGADSTPANPSVAGNWEPSLSQHRLEAVGPLVLTLFEPSTAGANFAF